MQHRGSHGMSRSPPHTPAPLLPSSASRSARRCLQATVHAAQPDARERAARTPLLMLALRIDAVHVCRRIPMQSAHSRSTAGGSIHSPPETAGGAFLVRQIWTPPPHPNSAPRAYRVREVSTPCYPVCSAKLSCNFARPRCADSLAQALRFAVNSRAQHDDRATVQSSPITARMSAKWTYDVLVVWMFVQQAESVPRRQESCAVIPTVLCGRLSEDTHVDALSHALGETAAEMPMCHVDLAGQAMATTVHGAGGSCGRK